MKKKFVGLKKKALYVARWYLYTYTWNCVKGTQRHDFALAYVEFIISTPNAVIRCKKYDTQPIVFLNEQ